MKKRWQSKDKGKEHNNRMLEDKQKTKNRIDDKGQTQQQAETVERKTGKITGEREDGFWLTKRQHNRHPTDMKKRQWRADRKMKSNTRTDVCWHIDGARMDIVEAEMISSLPGKKFAHI